jgi:hypothetical protein
MRVCEGIRYITASLRVCGGMYCTQRGGAGMSLHTLERPVRDASGRCLGDGGLRPRRSREPRTSGW